MLMVVSPAKTLDETCSYPKLALTTPRLMSDTKKLVTTLQGYDETAIAKLMDISPKLAALNTARYASFPKTLTEKNAKPAGFLFRGDVYAGLDIDTLPVKKLPQLHARLRILSGLYGILRPFDLMYPYRLEMGTDLKTAKAKNLYAFWGDKLANQLNDDAAELGTDTLINLASNEYAKAIDRKALGLREIDVQFKEERAGKLQVLGLFAKRARGMMARYIVESGAKTPRDLEGFSGGGYRFRADLSAPERLIFSRK